MQRPRSLEGAGKSFRGRETKTRFRRYAGWFHCGTQAPRKLTAVVTETQPTRKDFPMTRIVAIDHFTLDGVIQGPGSPDEDRRDGFEYGGWAGAQYDPELQRAVGARMGSAWSLLAGRRTYEHFFKVWPSMPKP